MALAEQGWRTRREHPPLNSRGPMIFMPQTLSFLFSSIATNCQPNCNRNMVKYAKTTYTSTVNTSNDFLIPRQSSRLPHPLDQILDPALHRSENCEIGIAKCFLLIETKTILYRISPTPKYTIYQWRTMY